MNPLHDKLRGFEIDIQRVSGHDLGAMRDALSVTATRPRLIILDTVKGHGVPFMENKMEWHYLPLRHEQYLQAIEGLGS